MQLFSIRANLGQFSAKGFLLMPLILEGLITTLDAAGALNLSPMGPIVDREQTEFLFRPFQTSRTYANLKREGAGVFHVVDNVLLLSKAAIGQIDSLPATFPAESIQGQILKDACRWFELEVLEVDDSQERTRIRTQVVNSGRNRDFWGFNRAKHAVIELAVLATRLFMTDREEVEREVKRLSVLIEKTAGEEEREAFELLREYIANYDAESS